MSKIPNKKSRPILVNGLKYRWMLKKLYAPGFRKASPIIFDLTIQAETNHRGVLKATLISKVCSLQEALEDSLKAQHKATVYPKDIEAIITRALSDNWDPESSSNFLFKTKLDLTEYSIEERSLIWK